ncbi:MAG TPA: lysylphosphatidylglycerol synthase transmembrane domain-containing protein [Candidatus Angelobacter sp.]|nr:lysylphosphatidylglycerol synthase transmembrane domain-containing protein [Candidatus Angelobacter sp.]
MNKKRLLITALVILLLAALLILQVRTWRKFEWHSFAGATAGINLLWVTLGVALIHFSHVLRAMRWKILLRPVCKTTARSLVPPTVIGFTAIALLGRPAELVRPYLIARKQNLRMASQMAVWTVERIFDMGAFALMTAVNLLVMEATLRLLPGFQTSGRAFQIFKISGMVLLGGVAVAGSIAFFVRKNPGAASGFVERTIGLISKKAGQAIAHRVHSFGEGLNTIHDLTSFVQIAALSLAIWIVIALSYIAVTHAYVDPKLSTMTLSSVLLLTAGSVAGGVLQLPVVGGGSQLATISILQKVFAIRPEVATSCGIMLWLVNFMSIIPAGLFFAHRERVSLVQLEEESVEETV